jgi:penicillin-binding protein 1A
MKKLILILAALAILGGITALGTYRYLMASLPKLITVEDYEPLLVTQVYDRSGKKIGEFFRERRILVPYKDIPKDVVNAFLAAEDDQFFQHGGINYLAILRATIANLRAGHTVQGASTITQQVTKTLLLTSEKTLLRKIKEAMLAQEIESHLTKEEILYLYLNQIYFGQGAYGIELAAQTYFRKPIQKLSLSEIAMLAGLPKAPSAYSPVNNPGRAKERQVYVLKRMAEVGFIKPEAADAAIAEPVKVYLRENFETYAPFYLETVRQMLNSQVGEDMVLDRGLKVTTSLDLNKQLAAQDAVTAGLKELDKRQGFRGALRNVTEPKEVGEFLLKTRNKLIADIVPERVILTDGRFSDNGPLNLEPDIKKGLPFYLKAGTVAEAVVSKVDDERGLVYMRVAEREGLIDISTMAWARKPDVEKRYYLDQIKKPSEALKMGDVVLVKVAGEKFGSARLNKWLAAKKEKMDLNKYIDLELDQEPIAEASLLSFDQQTEDVIAMIGGYKFEKNKNEYNRALQAARQTGSSFKSIVYASALDHGYTPSTPIMDAPIVFDESKKDDEDEGQGDEKAWRPSNHSKSFGGDIIFRNALVRSLNVPAVKIIEDLKIDWPTDYARRLGIFSKLNPDFTLVLGSSSVTLYEMTKVFSEFGRMGRKTKPILIKKVEDSQGKKILEQVSLDLRYQKDTADIDKDFEERRVSFFEAQKEALALAQRQNSENAIPSATPSIKDAKYQKPDANFFFEDPDQLIKPTTAYLMTSLLKAVVEDKHGTGGGARALGRDVAGKTGTTNGYYDAWFMGYTPQIATGVWVGFDHEKSLGKGEVGGRAALPIWIDYMKAAHENLPQMTFPVPDGIVFANIDSDTGQLASPTTKDIVRQAFVEGTEPSSSRNKKEEDTDFYKQDLSE